MPGPPPPPPPPLLGGGGSAPGAGAGRGQLLGAIHKGVALKKTVTNDRSAPIAVAAKAGPVAPTTGGSRGPIRPGNGTSSNGGNPGNGGPPLAGLFAGGMPKLKPTNRGAGDSAPAPPRAAAPNGPMGGQSPAPTSNGPTGNKRVFPGDIKNRGPPPQPPPAAHKPALAGAETGRRKSRNESLKQELSATRLVQDGLGKLSSKAEPAGGKTPGSRPPGKLPSAKMSELQAKLSASMGNEGAKPAPLRLEIGSMKDATSTRDVSSAKDPTVRREFASTRDIPSAKDVTVRKDFASSGDLASSSDRRGEKSPRPNSGHDVATLKKRLSSTSLVESAKPEPVVTRNKVDTIKRQLSRHSRDDSSASEGRLSGGVRTHGKPNLAPRPPSDPPHAQRVVSRAQSLRAPRSPPVLPPGAPPPSFDSRMQHMHASGLHQSQGSLPDYRTLPSKGGGRPRPPMSRPPPPPSRPPPPPVQAPPPPPPPHRTLPAAPPSPAVSHGNNNNNNNNSYNAARLQPGPPPTPARNSSMRGSGGGAEPFERNFTWRDAKEFPRPPPFRALPKVFNSVSVRLAGAGGKAQAPQPPVLQLGNKMFTRDTSRC